MDENKKGTMMVIDGNSLIHRAFYALPLLSTKDGIYTNGVYGFLTMLYRLMDEYALDHICVAFDKRGPTFRHEAFDLYKANRQSTPNELSQQFPILKQILAAMGIAQLELDGYEADDIAGTLSRMAEDNGMDVILVTGDKDYLQLASDNTRVLITRKGITELEEFDQKQIIEKYGITPDQFIDLKGLMGDASDNIPGVPGIGEKTGIKLIKQFGTMENLYDNIDKVGGKKTRESLAENKNIAMLSKTLGKIIRNAPIEFTFNELEIKEPNWTELKKIYEALEFNSLMPRIAADDNTMKRDTGYETVYQTIANDNYAPLIKQIESEKKICFKFLFSDDDYINNEIIGIGIKVERNTSHYIDFSQNTREEFVKQFKKYFESDAIEKSGHMLKMDIFALLMLDIRISNIVFDSMIGQYLINPAQTNYDMDVLVKEYLNMDIKSSGDILGKGRNKKSYRDLALDERAAYIASVLDLNYKIKKPMIELIKEQEMDKLFYEVELPLEEVLANMESIGFKVDVNVLNDLKAEFEEQINSLTVEIYALAGREFNINSPKQLGEILFDELGLPVIKRTKTGYSTDAEVLDRLKPQHPIIEKILQYRQIGKLKSTYVDGLLNAINPKTNRIHSSFNQTITNTGRISSTEPNLQNIPVRTEEGRKIRKAFIAKDGHILTDADYSQIELRVLAHITKDPKLLEAFYHDEDIHLKTASQVFHIPKEQVEPVMRNRAKAVNFGIIYGISDFGLAKDLGISRKEAKEYIDSYLKNFGMVKKYMDGIVKSGKEQGYVETILNRRRYIPELKSRNHNIRSFGERIAMNMPIQGSAADIIKVAMVGVFKELNRRHMKSRLVLQVHDELIIETYGDEVEEVKGIVKDIMENSVKLDVPLKIDLNTGENWYESK